MTEQPQGEGCGAGCAAVFVGMLVLGAVIAAVISITALIDPFSWMPLSPRSGRTAATTGRPTSTSATCTSVSRASGSTRSSTSPTSSPPRAPLSHSAGPSGELRERRPTRFESQARPNATATHAIASREPHYWWPVGCPADHRRARLTRPPRRGCLVSAGRVRDLFLTHPGDQLDENLRP